MKLATAVNQYLDQTAPWSAIKTDREGAGRTIFTALKAIDSLKVLFAPFLPFSSERLHGFFNHPGSLFGGQYTEDEPDSLGEHRVLRYRPEEEPELPIRRSSHLKPGTKLNQPGPLFKKLDESVIETERGWLGR